MASFHHLQGPLLRCFCQSKACKCRKECSCHLQVGRCGRVGRLVECSSWAFPNMVVEAPPVRLWPLSRTVLFDQHSYGDKTTQNQGVPLWMSAASSVTLNQHTTNRWPLYLHNITCAPFSWGLFYIINACFIPFQLKNDVTTCRLLTICDDFELVHVSPIRRGFLLLVIVYSRIHFYGLHCALDPHGDNAITTKSGSAFLTIVLPLVFFSKLILESENDDCS